MQVSMARSAVPKSALILLGFLFAGCQTTGSGSVDVPTSTLDGASQYYGCVTTEFMVLNPDGQAAFDGIVVQAIERCENHAVAYAESIREKLLDTNRDAGLNNRNWFKNRRKYVLPMLRDNARKVVAELTGQ